MGTEQSLQVWPPTFNRTPLPLRTLALLEALGIESKEDILSQKCAAYEKRSRKNVRGGGRMAVVTLDDQLLVMTLLRIRLGRLQQELAYIFDVSEAGESLTFQEVD